jgi:CheY-like chemotaxis protein
MSNSPSVMVVDDEEELAHLFSYFLEESGFNSVSFTDPLLALEDFKRNPEKFSLILTDLRMPGMNGVELAKRIREYNADAKIVLITAFYIDDVTNSDDFKKAGISNVLSKPVKLAQLRRYIKDECIQSQLQ